MKDVMIDSYIKKIFDIAISQIKSTNNTAFYITISKTVLLMDFKWDFCDSFLANNFFSINSDKILFSIYNPASTKNTIVDTQVNYFSNLVDKYIANKLEKDFDLIGIKSDLINTKEALKNVLQKENIVEIALVLIYVLEKDLKEFLQSIELNTRFIYIVVGETDNLNNCLDVIKQTKNTCIAYPLDKLEVISITKKLYIFEKDKTNFIVHHYKRLEDYEDFTKRFIYEYINFHKKPSI